MLLLVLGAGSLSRAAPAPGFAGTLVFPVAGGHRMADTFGAPRGGGRRHAGVDIMAAKGTPVVAVADGEVRWVLDGDRCCSVALTHAGGWRSRYIHLDNDTPGTDDGRRVGIARGVRRGARVRRGQILGWVGDSGNAEATAPHLHFELRRPDGEPVDPFAWLETAERVEPPAGFERLPPRIVERPEEGPGAAEPGTPADRLAALGALEGEPLPLPPPGRGWRSPWGAALDPELTETSWVPRPDKGRGWGWSCAFLVR